MSRCEANPFCNKHDPRMLVSPGASTGYFGTWRTRHGRLIFKGSPPVKHLIQTMLARSRTEHDLSGCLRAGLNRLYQLYRSLDAGRIMNDVRDPPREPRKQKVRPEPPGSPTSIRCTTERAFFEGKNYGSGHQSNSGAFSDP